VHVGPNGPVEVARHLRATPGSPKTIDAHFPPAPAGALDRQPKAKNAAETEFLALGGGARLWLTEAAAAGTTKMRLKMAEAVALAKLGDPVKVDWALGHAAVNSRFAEADLASILTHHARIQPGPRHRPANHAASPKAPAPGPRCPAPQEQTARSSTETTLAASTAPAVTRTWWSCHDRHQHHDADSEGSPESWRGHPTGGGGPDRAATA